MYKDPVCTEHGATLGQVVLGYIKKQAMGDKLEVEFLHGLAFGSCPDFLSDRLWEL